MPVGAVPTRLPEDIHARRRYLDGGLVALVAEALLAAWIFALRGVPPLFGILAAICITLVFDRALDLVLVAKNPRPKEALRTVKRRLVLPAFLAFVLAAAFLALARYVEGGLALALLPLFSGALWAATMALLLLAAALFCAAHLYGTTLRLEEEYTQVDREARANFAVLQILEREGQLVEAEVIPPEGKRSSGSHRGLHAAMLLLALGAGASCRPSPDSNNAVVAAATMPEQARCEVVLDLSGSVVGLDRVWAHLRSELPSVVAAARCRELTVSGFDTDGWMPRPLVRTLELPDYPPPSSAGELGVFRNIREAETAAGAQRYATALRDTLAALDSVQLPDSGVTAKGSDVVGVLQRVAQLRDARPRLVLLVTDLTDSRHRTLPLIAAPAGDVRLLLLLTPATAGEIRRATGERLTAAEQYALRIRKLQRAAPWVRAVPFFTEDLAVLLASSDSIR